jgi:two-component system, cell cycle sensor histidine kinase and response regulator CckA
VSQTDAPAGFGSDSTFEQLVEAAPDAMVGVGEAGAIVLVNSQAGPIKVHLPATDREPGNATASADARPAGAGEVILVVEDEPDVRRMAERILTKAAYTVIGTHSGEEALEICAGEGQRIDLLLTDVIMPEMLGTELVDRARELRPEAAVVFMSGYSHEVLAPGALAEQEGSAFIEKPFGAGELLRTIRGLLDGAGEELA